METNNSLEILNPEDKNTEYKTVSTDTVPNNIWDTICAFANTDGGSIFLGVKENNKNKQLIVTGINNFNKLKTDLLNTQKSNKISRPVFTENDIQEINVKLNKAFISIHYATRM